MKLSKYKYLRGNKQVVKMNVKYRDGSETTFYTAIIIRDEAESFSGKLPSKRFASIEEAQNFLDNAADIEEVEWTGENEKVPVFAGTYRKYERVHDEE